MPSKTTTNTTTSTNSRGCTKHAGPGPLYLLPSTVGYDGHDITRDRRPAFSIARRIQQAEKTSGPGPMSNVDKVDRFGPTGGPAFSIYPKLKSSEYWQTPGPGAYCPECHPPKGPAFSLLPRIQPPDSKVTVPGPNSYMLPSSLNGTVEYLGMRLEPPSEKYKSPGPAKYLPKHEAVKWKGPQFSFGQRLSPPQDRSEKPGPAKYLPTYNSRRTPQFSFGVKHSECKGIPMTDADKYPDCPENIPACGA